MANYKEEREAAVGVVMAVFAEHEVCVALVKQNRGPVINLSQCNYYVRVDPKIGESGGVSFVPVNSSGHELQFDVSEFGKVVETFKERNMFGEVTGGVEVS